MMRQRESKVLEHNRELQHTILDLESKLEEVQDRNQTAFEMVSSVCNCVKIWKKAVGKYDVMTEKTLTGCLFRVLTLVYIAHIYVRFVILLN